jgi:phosphoribosylanthranilate isomerase
VSMTWIKICGITNLEDALLAVDAGADAVGFVFYEKSPRRVDVETAREIVAKLPERVEKVGVFVEEPPDALDVYNAVRLTAIQRQRVLGASPGFSSQKAIGLSCYWQSPKFYTVLSAPWMLAEEGRLRGVIASFARWGEGIPEETRKMMPSGLFDTFFLDSSTAEKPGGTGISFDWQKAVPLVNAMRAKVKVVVAGGLNPDNVGEAIRTLHPWGVDVASGTEATPGKKDPKKVRAFVEAVRRADKAA